MADLYQEITEFSGGVQSAGPADRIPLNSTPQAHNTAFRNIGSGVANLGARPGLAAVNTTAFTGSPHVIFQRPYSYDNAGTLVRYLPTLGSNGTLRYKNDDDTYTSPLAPPANFPAPSGLCFTAATDTLVDSTVMNNRLFLVSQSGERRALLGQDYVPWGLTAVASWSVANAASGINAMPNETYDVALTTYHGDTGGESTLTTATAVSMAGGNRRLLVTISPTAAESAQYPYWRVYIRRQTTQAELHLVSTLYNAAGTAIVTDGNIPIGTTTAYVDLSDSMLANLTTTGLLSGAGDPPPSGIRHIATYGRRLLASNGRNLYWSLIDKPDNFHDLDFEPIDTGEGDIITGLSVFSDELLLVLTTSAIYGLFGNDPQTWALRPIDHTIGCAGHQSIVEFDAKVAWWSATDGPVLYDGTSITRIGLDALGKAAVVDAVEQSRLDFISAAPDHRDSRVVWTYPLTGATLRNTRILPYNYRLKQFESSEWSPMDICSVGAGIAADGTARLFAGNYAGQVFAFDDAIHNDGIASGTTHTVSFTPASSSITTITGTGFDTTGAGLAERYAVIVDHEDRFIAKVRIASNTSTVLTLAAALTPLATGATYTAYLGSPDVRLYTKWMDLDQTFIRKRFDRVFFQVSGSGQPGALALGTQVDFQDTTTYQPSALTTTGALWDTAIWDTSAWSGTSVLKKRLSILRTGQSIRLALFHVVPNQDVIVHTIGVLARAQSDRYFAS